MNGRVVRRGSRVVGNCLAPETAPVLEGAGLVISGHADDGTIEIVELPALPFLLATLFQPQVTTDQLPLHPLLLAFSEAVVLNHLRRDVRAPSH